MESVDPEIELFDRLSEIRPVFPQPVAFFRCLSFSERNKIHSLYIEPFHGKMWLLECRCAEGPKKNAKMRCNCEMSGLAKSVFEVTPVIEFGSFTALGATARH